MSKSLGNSLVIPEVLKRVRGIELRFYMVGAHYRSHVEFSHQALEEAAVGWRRIENFLDRVRPGGRARRDLAARLRGRDGRRPGHPGRGRGALRRRARGQPAAGGGESATATAGQVLAMLNVLGLDPGDPGWPSGGGGDAKLTAAVDVLVAALLDRRAEARAAKDFAAADAIRDRIKAAGIEIEDTPDGPKWTI